MAGKNGAGCRKQSTSPNIAPRSISDPSALTAISDTVLRPLRLLRHVDFVHGLGLRCRHEAPRHDTGRSGRRSHVDVERGSHTTQSKAKRALHEIWMAETKAA